MHAQGHEAKENVNGIHNVVSKLLFLDFSMRQMRRGTINNKGWAMKTTIVRSSLKKLEHCRSPRISCRLNNIPQLIGEIVLSIICGGMPLNYLWGLLCAHLGAHAIRSLLRFLPLRDCGEEFYLKSLVRNNKASSWECVLERRVDPEHFHFWKRQESTMNP